MAQFLYKDFEKNASDLIPDHVCVDHIEMYDNIAHNILIIFFKTPAQELWKIIWKRTLFVKFQGFIFYGFLNNSLVSGDCPGFQGDIKNDVITKMTS